MHNFLGDIKLQFNNICIVKTNLKLQCVCYKLMPFVALFFYRVLYH